MTIDFVPVTVCRSLRKFFFHAAVRNMPSCAFITVRLFGLTFGYVRFRDGAF